MVAANNAEPNIKAYEVAAMMLILLAVARYRLFEVKWTISAENALARPSIDLAQKQVNRSL